MADRALAHEVILVDDGSTDGTARIMDEWAAKDHRVSSISQPNAGKGAALNRGFAASDGEVVLFGCNRLAKASGGGALALFTSKRSAEEAAAILRERLDVEILCQGDASMKSLVAQFAEERDTCLFGTMTLWQGVDVPGDSRTMLMTQRCYAPIATG